MTNLLEKKDCREKIVELDCYVKKNDVGLKLRVERDHLST